MSRSFKFLSLFCLSSGLASASFSKDAPAAVSRESQPKEVALAKPITVILKRDGKSILNGQPLTEAELQTQLRHLAVQNKDVEVFINGDDSVDYPHVKDVLNTCQKAGIWNITFAKRQPAAAAPSH